MLRAVQAEDMNGDGDAPIARPPATTPPSLTRPVL
jgi:hypothetical protein